MVVQTFVTQHGSLVPIEVELVLVKGLPQIQFVGLPDQNMKESKERIKCALKKQGFEFPKAQQILVNLRPNSMKKTSRGAELAVAAAILWETGQVPPPLPQSNLFLYGEIDLQGNVYEPEDLARSFHLDARAQVMTGQGLRASKAHSFQKLVVPNLKSLAQPQMNQATTSLEVKRKDFNELLCVKESFANLIRYFAVEPFHVLMAGPAGSGKSTLAKNLIHFLQPPSEEDLRSISAGLEKPLTWWPLIAPHPTITARAFLGNERSPGEVFRAHRGILFLDELLEFKAEALEVLRAPLDGHEILVSRVDQRVQKRSDFKCVATTNLCPCGEWLPGLHKEFECALPERKCTQYRQKLSGPMLDRFEVLFLTDHKQEKFIAAADLLTEIKKQKREVVVTEDIERQLIFVSARRRNAFQKLLRAVTAVHGADKCPQEITQIAYDLTIGNFQKLQPQSLGAISSRNVTIPT